MFSKKQLLYSGLVFLSGYLAFTLAGLLINKGRPVFQPKLSRELFASLHKVLPRNISEREQVTVHSTDNGSLSNEVTIVTAYFNIGNFSKGSRSNVVGKWKYVRWMNVFGRIQNPLVAFFDDEDFLKIFFKIRKHLLHKTKIYLIKRQDLWSFQIQDLIQKIFDQPSYPKFLPNTVVSEYSCVMHSKFELLSRAVDNNYFKTKYISWLDIGLFRYDTTTFDFGIWLPPDFEADKVAYSRVGNFEDSLDVKTIISSNYVWVSGAMNIATMSVMKRFTQDYLKFVKYSLSLAHTRGAG